MNSKSVIKILVALYSVVIVFHICIVLKIIPYNITWGGRLKNDSEMYVFETVSIAINFFLSWVLLMKGGFVKFKFSRKAIRIILWVFVLVFTLNTIGNIFAKTNLEKFFIVLTFISAVAITFVLLKKESANINEVK